MTKGQYYTQTNSNTPVLRDYRPYFLNAQALASSNGAVNSVMLNPPSVAGRGLFPRLQSPLFEFTERAVLQSTLDTSFASGTYTFACFTRNQGMTNLAISLTGNAYPNTPRLTNWAAAQNINAAEPFSLGWEPMTGGASNDFIYLRIDNSTGTVFSTSIRPGATNALNGIATGVTLPANTLKPGCGYLARLLFQNTTATTQNYGEGYAGYVRQTDIFLAATNGSQITPPVLVSTFPPQDATGVPVNAPIMLQFDRPMRGFSISYNTTNEIHHVWSSDRRTCVITATYPWPSGNTITFRFNALESFLSFSDDTYTPLPPDQALRLTYGSGSLNATPARPVFAARPHFTNGVFHFELQGESFRGYVLQFSGDLANWQGGSTNYSTSNRLTFAEPFATGASNRFYRMLALPLP